MKTIGAKELRLHLDQIIDRVLRGEDVVVQHRFKEPIRLSALRPPKPSSHKLPGLHAFDAAPKRPSPFDPHTPIKDLYHESISSKYAGR